MEIRLQFLLHYLFNFINAVAYKAYRFNVTANWGHADTGLLELEFKHVVSQVSVKNLGDTEYGAMKVKNVDIADKLTDGVNEITVAEIVAKADAPIIAENADVDVGTEVVDSFSDLVSDACLWTYRVKDGSNLRVGRIVAVWDAVLNTIEYTETSTQDIGDTSALTLDVVITADNVELRATLAVGADYSVKAKRELI